jgi:hypothetical protein
MMRFFHSKGTLYLRASKMHNSQDTRMTRQAYREIIELLHLMRAELI